MCYCMPKLDVGCLLHSILSHNRLDNMERQVITHLPKLQVLYVCSASECTMPAGVTCYF